MSLFRAGAVYGLSNALSAGIPFIMLPVLTRALTPAEYGEVVSFFLWVTLCSSIAGLSLHSAVPVRWIEQEGDGPKTSTGAALLLVLASSTLVAAASAFVAPLTGLGLSGLSGALAAVVAGCTVVQGIRFGVWQVKDRPWPAALLQIISSALNILLSLIGVLMLRAGADGRILGAVTAFALIALASVLLLIHGREISLSQSRNELRHLLRFGLPLVPHALAGAALASADRFAVSSQLGNEALGMYGTAAQIGMALTVLADAMVKAYSPAMYRMFRRNNESDRLKVVGIAYLSIPFWAVTGLAAWVCASLFGPWLLGPEFHEAIRISAWFIAGAAVSGVYLTIAGVFFFSSKTERISIATATGAVFAVAVAPIAVRHFGIAGAGATYVGAQLCLLVTAWRLSHTTFPLPWNQPLQAIHAVLGYQRLEA